ncbi:MAG: hypothetical protein AAF725_25600, partial [Acidobacteriota bacterium]
TSAPMSFQHTLASLLDVNRGALAVCFLDDSGETVDLACGEDFTAYEMKVVGAYIGIYMRQMAAVMEAASLGTPELLHIEKDELHLFAAPLPDDYYLVLVQRCPALTARSRRSLVAARDDIAREIFS